MSTERDELDPVNQAAEVLRKEPLPEGPPADLIAATVNLMETQTGVIPAELARKLQKRRRLMRVMTFGGCSVATAVVVCAMVLLTSGRSAADDVKKAIRKAEQAKSLRFVTELDSGTETKIVSKNFIVEGKMRSEVEPTGLIVVINDKSENKGLLKFTAMKMYKLLDPEKDELIKGVTKNVKSTLSQFKIPADDKVQGLPDEFLDGRKTKVYEIKGIEVPELKGTADLKMWIDPKTDMPVRSRVATKVEGKTYTATATYLGFDEELDPKLFDTTIPEGYKPLPEQKK